MTTFPAGFLAAFEAALAAIKPALLPADYPHYNHHALGVAGRRLNPAELVYLHQEGELPPENWAKTRKGIELSQAEADAVLQAWQLDPSSDAARFYRREVVELAVLLRKAVYGQPSLFP